MPSTMPLTVAQLVLPYAVKSGVNYDNPTKASMSREHAEDVRSWLAVSREWAQIIASNAWANRVMSLEEFTRCPSSSGRVGGVCQPLFPSCIHSISLTDVKNDWVKDNLAHFAPTLVWLSLEFKEPPTSDSLHALQHCVNVKRLGIKCDKEQRGNLHDVLDELRYLPKLEHLALGAFDAPSSSRSDRRLPTSRKKRRPSQPVPAYTVPSTLAVLSLRDLDGPRLDKFLASAFNSSYLFSLTSLALSGFSNTFSRCILVAIGSTLAHLSIEIDCRDSPPSSILPKHPFPALKHLTVELLGTTPSSFALDARNVGRYHNDIRLERLTVVDPPNWTEPAIENEVVKLQRIFPLKDMPDEEEEGLVAPLHSAITEMVHDDAIPAKEKVLYRGSFLLAASFDKLPKERTALFEPPPAMLWMPLKEVLEEGAMLRRKKEEEDKVNKAEAKAGTK